MSDWILVAVHVSGLATGAYITWVIMSGKVSMWKKEYNNLSKDYNKLLTDAKTLAEQSKGMMQSLFQYQKAYQALHKMVVGQEDSPPPEYKN